MTDLAPQDRPREKLEKRGASALGDNELVAVLIGHGTLGTSALTLANQILALSGGVHGLTRLHRDRLAPDRRHRTGPGEPRPGRGRARPPHAAAIGA